MKRIKVIMLITTLLAIIYSCSKDDPLVINDNLIVIPTAFSPNNDGANDTWFITDQYNLIDSNHYVVRIFNDSSQVKVFESTKKYSSWDGNYNSNPQPIGNYSYYVDYKTWNDIEHIRTGTIYLSR